MTGSSQEYDIFPVSFSRTYEANFITDIYMGGTQFFACVDNSRSRSEARLLGDALVQFYKYHRLSPVINGFLTNRGKGYRATGNHRKASLPMLREAKYEIELGQAKEHWMPTKFLAPQMNSAGSNSSGMAGRSRQGSFESLDDELVVINENRMNEIPNELRKEMELVRIFIYLLRYVNGVEPETDEEIRMNCTLETLSFLDSVIEHQTDSNRLSMLGFAVPKQAAQMMERQRDRAKNLLVSVYNDTPGVETVDP